MHPIRRAALGFAASLVLTVGGASAQTKLLRYPDVHKDKVVFTYAGDLWTAPSSGGTATRLTAHPGLEMFAKFSPDGKWIAFTGQYDGDEQVYVIPATGGAPRQLTYYPARGPMTPRWGYDNQVHGWTRDGQQVLFRSLRDGWDLSDSRLYTVPRDGGVGEPLAMPLSGAGDFSPDGRKVVYTPIARDFRTWKRYQGGWNQDLYLFDISSHDATAIAKTPRTERDPMWIGGKIYFNSDRTGTLNLFSYDVASGKVDQLTKSTRWDVRWPSADEDGQIVYESEGELAIYDVRSGAERKLAISVPTDGLYDRPSQISVAGRIEDFTLSPKGERALVTARGDVFSAPVEKGVTRNLTRSSSAHDREGRWSPDGRKVAFLSDRSGEEEIWLVNPDGSGKPEELTTGARTRRLGLEWSPDSKRIAFSEVGGRLAVVTVADKKVVDVARDAERPIRDFVWSPESGHLAFSMMDANGLRSIYVWSAEDGKTRRVTSEEFYESDPAWDPEGRYLYYLSARSFAPLLDDNELNYVQDRSFGIYAMALRKDVAHPFPPEDDKVTIDGGEEKKEAGKEDKPAVTRIDFDGLSGRVARVPVPFDNYAGLSAAKGRLVYVKASTAALGREPIGQTSLQVFDLKSRKATPLAERMDGYTISQDGSKVLVVAGGEYGLYDVAAGKDSKKVMPKDGLVVDRVPREEWTEIFDEAWRRFRDYFYVENMHGYDWAALREQYRPLLAHVGHRSDLNYVIGEMIAELNVSHAYVVGGDFDLPPRPKVALPGARFELDGKAGRYRIAKIFAGQNEEDLYRSPLTEIGVDVRVGDYVLAIDGEELAANDNPYRLLRHKADRPFVRLTVNGKPTLEGAREVSFRPVDTETNLIYLDWVTGNRERVAKLTDGKVGYLHVPDMGEDGLREFIKSFYSQVKKEGLVVDVRGNGGGFISPMLLDRLMRRPLSVDFGRTAASPQPYPPQAFYGPMACLINESSMSDGDVFPAMFKELGLGPLIGKRTWGGVVGISGRGPLLDGGQVSVPEFASSSLQGEWIIEGHGVDPDIEVDNDPKSLLAGRDPQLERAVEEIQKAMREKPKVWPKRPAPPVKTQGR
ncbi:MAG TPA: S41 family peptidase [Thermoanaerobaculia bacterium]|nr:S41 family peptidase [Thermoanaerobaculia bacterium]